MTTYSRHHERDAHFPYLFPLWSAGHRHRQRRGTFLSTTWLATRRRNPAL